MNLVPYEINAPGPGAIAIVGRDPGADEVRQGRPFVGKAGRLLDDCLAEAGIDRARINILNVSRFRPPGNRFEAHPRAQLEAEISHLHETLAKLKPSVVVALGNEAAHALVPDWPGRDIKAASGIEERRGYIFDSSLDAPVIVTVHPAFVARTWSPWRVLLSFDLQRAKELSRAGLRRPVREVHVVSSHHDARQCVAELRRYRRLAADIENDADTNVSCVGFAGESGRAIVFPARYLDAACEVLRRPDLTTIWVNGIYDLFVLAHRNEVRVAGRVEDAMIAWHAAYPELAGAKEDKRKHRFTRKSLSFLASLATHDPWWKDYDFASGSTEQFTLCGRDVCTTLDVFDWVMKEVEKVGALATYEHERSLMWPCVDMLARGLNVNDALRVERRDALEGGIAKVRDEANEIVIPLIERERERLAEMDVLRLFEETDPTCTCCGHGAKKQMACWACAGFTKAPTKADLVKVYPKYVAAGDAPEWDLKKVSKAQLEDLILPVCHVCCGAPRETRLVVNLNSNIQAQILLYEILRLPKRFKKNAKGESVLTTDEATLKNLLGGIPS